VFLDRDGTVSEEVGYLNHINRFRLLAGVAAAIRKLNESALPVIVVTNQSGVARGYFPEQLVREVHERMTAELAEAGAHLDGVYYCPHQAVDECECRKPKIGMMELAARELELDLRKCFVVGDRYGDIELANRAGACGILVRTGYGEGDYAWHGKCWAYQPHYVAADLAEAVQWILRKAQR
jgi:D-glycero-D-manno-heptose 1,7-bisphosphate phosphatase